MVKKKGSIAKHVPSIEVPFAESRSSNPKVKTAAEKALNRSKDGLKKLVDALAKYLPHDLLVDRTCIPEDSLVQLARRSNSLNLRCGLSELYRAGYFGRHDVVRGYAWTLAGWNCKDVTYDEKFKLAEIQQYYEFFLSTDEQARAIQVLPKAKPCRYVVGTPFNAGWWGWEDDPIPARPGERDFKVNFVQWLMDGCFSDAEISDILVRCPPSDGPTRRDRVESMSALIEQVMSQRER